MILNWWVLWTIALAGMLAMIAFGGRTSLALALVMVMIIMAVRLLGVARGARFGRLSTALTFLASPFIVAGIAAAASSGSRCHRLAR